MIENRTEAKDPLYTRKEAARYLSELGLITAPQTLARKFHEGRGPLCTRVGDRAKYRKSHLDAYFRAQVSAPRGSSSEPTAPIGDDAALLCAAFLPPIAVDAPTEHDGALST